ncbi:hypothetical protein F4781DRAFT_24425 [Annulohypoxylon bovei var. microspora]|nr:hypothetical protein F4781DRAFT_24425 [Annulohypoxylon bovei var. microspora]
MATAAPVPARPPSPSPSQVPLPGSPTYSYASTANPLSSYNLPLPPPPRPIHAVLTKSDLEQSQQAYSDLLSTAKTYRIALSSLSTAASTFGSALESCARLKESRADALGPPGGTSLTNSFTAKNSCTADLLLSASGVHHLVANHQQILSETVYRSFEVPLLHELDQWRRAIEDEDETYKREAAARSREIRRLEKEGLKLHRQTRRRDVAQFREHLVTLTTKLDGLTALHADHARTLLRESQETSAKILDASCSLVRAEVDIFEGLARKGWTGGGLDDLLEKGQDLFASEDDVPAVVATPGGVVAGAAGNAGDGGAKLFSILPPKSILASDSASDSVLTARGGEGHGRADSLLVDPDDVQYQSLTGAVGQKERGREADSQSLFSDSNLSQGRGLRPFSPQPIRRRPTDVVMDPESLLVGDEELRTDDDDDDGNDDDSYDAATVRGVRDSSTQRVGLGGLRIGADENNIEEAESPWKDEGLRQTQDSTTSSSTNDEPPPADKDEVDNR